MPRISNPSDAAIHAAWIKLREPNTASHDVLNAAHHPELGNARSVCLQDILDYLRSTRDSIAAGDLEREFGSPPPPPFQRFVHEVKVHQHRNGGFEAWFTGTDLAAHAGYGDTPAEALADLAHKHPRLKIDG